MDEWTIEYENDTGADDGAFWEWWLVVKSERAFGAKSIAEAIWLRDRLNRLERESDETPLDWEWLRQWADNNDVDALGFGNISAARMRREIVWLLIPEAFWPQTRGDFFTLCRQLRVELTPQSPAAQTPPPG